MRGDFGFGLDDEEGVGVGVAGICGVFGGLLASAKSSSALMEAECPRESSSIIIAARKMAKSGPMFGVVAATIDARSVESKTLSLTRVRKSFTLDQRSLLL
jgi:hypothetical protein